MVIFHSYVSLPEGKSPYNIFQRPNLEMLEATGMFPQRSQSFSQRSENLLQVLGANTKLFLEMDHGQTWMTIWMIWDYSGIIVGLYWDYILGLDWDYVDDDGDYGLLVSPKGGPILQHGLMTLNSCMGQPSFPGYPPVIKHGNGQSHMVFPLKSPRC